MKITSVLYLGLRYPFQNPVALIRALALPLSLQLLLAFLNSFFQWQLNPLGYWFFFIANACLTSLFCVSCLRLVLETPLAPLSSLFRTSGLFLLLTVMLTLAAIVVNQFILTFSMAAPLPTAISLKLPQWLSYALLAPWYLVLTGAAVGGTGWFKTGLNLGRQYWLPLSFLVFVVKASQGIILNSFQDLSTTLAGTVLLGVLNMMMTALWMFILAFAYRQCRNDKRDTVMPF
ncbi:hypothetical protein PVT67_11545 [Gallaecimonas kandeliae]|uniref:hypothetical protein n=1 Tax=Gallaecimonas kandeliae TaxID=3029055 RepID=UPI0026477795|nr:hypothetical protein [Gallaecimonas kandeliae]WKE64314.1 hypothetical protein PVT67_11545 [Gallaecimonas kandeliae]